MTLNKGDMNHILDDINIGLKGDKNNIISGLKIKHNKEVVFDDLKEFKSYKNFMFTEVKNEVQFKRKARNWSLTILSALSLFLFINIFVMIYGSGSTIKKITIPTFDSKIILAMITATFVNLFAIITLVFKYIFSPTSDLMNHAKDMNGKE